MTGAEIKSLPKVNRVVLVGNKISLTESFG